MRFVLLVLVALFIGGQAFAGPFFQRRSTGPPSCSGGSCYIAPTYTPEVTTSQIASTPSPESKPVEAPVPQPWLLISEADDTYSQPPDTVLGPLAGTGSKLGIGVKLPDKILHTLDAATLAELRKILMEATSPAKGPVHISLPIPEETSQRLSRISQILEWLLWLGGAYFGISTTGRVLPAAVRVGVGLLSGIAGQLPQPPPTPAATSSVAPSPSPVGNQAGQSSTSKPVI